MILQVNHQGNKINLIKYLKLNLKIKKYEKQRVQLINYFPKSKQVVIFLFYQYHLSIFSKPCNSSPYSVVFVSFLGVEGA